ncbi:ABC transporter [Actinomyces sp. S6-Spd3]|uniref:MetQ/NlpA family ABC transporter substrate-binding protein n=1 Tax=Actinomyces TaxID=1654 RepID=UPI00050DA6E2|nr:MULTISPECIES: MetQ/NlpA family ABC transporter substrate-binding protein [Actinomyces]KGF00989.1 ABC transporter [Actinomyces sp. S6-Spd3]MBF0949077.1 ABC transporter [Actinomyces sp.]MDU1431001.1 MetQ/NlpA family ABC transporter substrate-binding protein [Actinomyces sp.]
MRHSRSLRTLAGLGVAAALVLSACSSGSAGSSSSSNGATTITVAASPSPHAKILKYIQDNLAKDAGININIKEFTDYDLPNRALDQGEVDATYHQTVPYLEKAEQQFNYDFTPGKGIHLEPLAIYSSKHKSLDELPEKGGIIGVISDVTNQERALRLLAANGFVEIPASGDVNVYTVKKLKNFDFKEIDGPVLVSNLGETDYSVINGNFAQEGGLAPSRDGLAVESPENNPSVNVLVWKTSVSGDKAEAVKKLDELLHSDQVKKYIEDTWKDGSVIPAF